LSYDIHEADGLQLEGQGDGRRQLHVGGFFGGRKHGACVQITIGGRWVQLDVNMVRELRDKLNAWLLDGTRPESGD
jgi:hypothetical protein